MFAILPQNGYIFESDAEFFNTEEEAYDSAFDWSVELNGATVNVCHVSHNGTVNVWAQVHA
jgi:hypothetical protein